MKWKEVKIKWTYIHTQKTEWRPTCTKQNKKHRTHSLTHTLCVCRNVGFFEWRILWFFLFFPLKWPKNKKQNKKKIRNQVADIMMMIINNNDINQIEIHSWSSFICFFSTIWWLWCEYDRHLNVEIFWIEFGGGAAAPVFVCVFVYVFWVSWWWWFWSRI